MTQAELAGGMANAAQARPAKGQLIRANRDASSAVGQIVQLECLRSGIWGTASLWGRVVTYKG
jgi:hypothetical protein